MSKTPAQIPDAIGLQHLSSVKDVEGTAKHLEWAIDGLIDAREIRANADSRRMWKNCVKHWYKAIYPYVSFGLGQVAVLYIPSDFPAYSQDFVPTPYGYVVSAILYILEVLTFWRIANPSTFMTQ